jgi:hypothetical protein
VFLPPLILGTVALAAAVAAPLSIDLNIHARGTADRGGSVVVRGTVACSIDTIASIEVFVVQALNRSDAVAGQFFTDLACDGTPTPWTAVIDPDTDRTFRPGFATVVVRATAFDPENGIFAAVETLASLQLTRSIR